MKTYKTIKDFENAIQEDLEELPDNVEINKIVYTMDNYDMEGKEVSYGNKRFNFGLIVTTQDRYKEGLNAIIKDEEIAI